MSADGRDARLLDSFSLTSVLHGWTAGTRFGGRPAASSAAQLASGRGRPRASRLSVSPAASVQPGELLNLVHVLHLDVNHLPEALQIGERDWLTLRLAVMPKLRSHLTDLLLVCLLFYRQEILKRRFRFY